MTNIKCVQCSKKFFVKTSRKYSAKTCSLKCRNIYLKSSCKLGWIKRRKNGFGSPSEQTRKKMSESLMGNTWGFKKNMIPWNKDTKGVCKAWNKGLPGLKGELNGAWKGTDDKYWRYKCLERDNYTCRECKLREPEIMEVDHIKQKGKHPQLRYVLNNLQTLCPNCHKRKTIKELKQKKK
jgi:HNH endonuclease